ncbi:Tyrosine recombinase XerD [compost metagenome]
MSNLIMDSKYFSFWSEHVPIIHKEKVVSVLKKFEKFLEIQGFEGELNFDEFHGNRKKPDAFLPIQEKVIDKFVGYLRDDCGASTFVLYNSIVALKNFFGFLYDNEMISTHPMQDYPNHYYYRPVKNTALTKDECMQVLYYALKKDPFFRYEFVLFWFIIVTGLRKTEVRMLRRSKIDFDSRRVFVNEGQKNASRVVYLTPALAEEIKRFIQHPQYALSERNGDGFLFNQLGNSANSLCKVIRELCSDAGITRTVTPHDLRRTAAYLMQTGGINIIEVQKQLGHKILATTLRYTPPLKDLAQILICLDSDK